MSQMDSLPFLAFLLDLQHYLATFSHTLRHHHNETAADLAHQSAQMLAQVIDTWPAEAQDAAHNLAPWEISDHPACDLKWLYDVDYLISAAALAQKLADFLNQLLNACQSQGISDQVAQLLRGFIRDKLQPMVTEERALDDWDPPHMPS